MLVVSSTHGGENNDSSNDVPRNFLSGTRGVGERLVALKYVPIECE